ncbi:MAG: ATP cone domain-containing protein, partial [Bacilli bacterium]
MLSVKKRDGSVVEFNLEKISKAIEKAFIAEHVSYTKEIIDLLSLKVTSNFSDKVKGEVISVEDIQDAVEITLIESGYVKVAKAYMLYRQQHKTLRGVATTTLDYKKLVDSYLHVSDWRV